MYSKNKKFQHSDITIFLLISSWSKLSNENKQFISSYLNMPDLEIKTFITLAKRHGVLPLVQRTLEQRSHEKSSSKQTNQTLLRYLKSSNQYIVQKNMLISAALLQLLKLFEKHAIEVLPFKGPTLSQLLYENITLRQYTDLDLLIEKNDRDKAYQILQSQGYTPLYKLTTSQKAQWYKHAKDMTLFHAEKGIHIDLHWSLLDNDYPMQIDSSTIWANPQTVTINKQKIKTFSNNRLLFYLCIHGSKHLWERILWIKDIDMLIRTQKIDWETIKEEVNQSDFKRMFLLGLYLSNSLFQTPLPRYFQEAIKDQKWLKGISDFIFSQWNAPQSMFHNTLAMLHLFPTMKMKLLYLYKIILKPSKNEYRFISLPKGFYWIYYLIRPYLLLKKYLHIK
ncbi:MAG: nucleotidyltransferase family protein [Campylobacterota bacterium]|nr:nucleotidyltransferase family protein [Campylobacterota bacterium]